MSRQECALGELPNPDCLSRIIASASGQWSGVWGLWVTRSLGSKRSVVHDGQPSPITSRAVPYAINQLV